ncbi:hypothetical protein C1Y42_19510 [Pantoea sp. ICBG 985]|nr:hypothetical protein NS375_17205 [Pantoea dispersa]PPC68682.1 hypothetical protein C1Y42_19510 [Pantoea sp. ICBG 985]
MAPLKHDRARIDAHRAIDVASTVGCALMRTRQSAAAITHRMGEQVKKRPPTEANTNKSVSLRHR